MKKKIYVFSFLTILFSIPIIMLLKTPTKLDNGERRKLQTELNINAANIINGNVDDKLEEYLSDQFPFRSIFRHIKSRMNYNVFLKKEYDNIIIKGNIAIKVDNTFSYENVKKTTLKLQSLINDKLENNNCFFVLVPDKNCLIENVNYKKCIDIISSNINAKMISVNTKLYDYYKYDSHWNQKYIVGIANNILTEMNNKIDNIEYDEKEINDFLGVYSANTALNKTEAITYLNNDEIENAKVLNYETNKYTNVYDLSKLEDEKSLDKYDIFLSGAVSLLKIDNKQQTNGKTLIIFRDSYGSSITPLFIHYYSTIYLIDLRYISSNYIENFITFKPDDDIIFLYSTTIMETPENFKIISK